MHRFIPPEDERPRYEYSTGLAVFAIVLTLLVCVGTMFNRGGNIRYGYMEQTGSSLLQKLEYSEKRAESVFGNGLLLNVAVEQEECSTPYECYALRYEREGSVHERDSWIFLEALIKYENDRIAGSEIGREEMTDGRIYLHIYFDGDDQIIYEKDRLSYLRNNRSGVSETRIINGVSVKLSDIPAGWSGDIFTYSPESDYTARSAEFEYGGSIYFVQAYSKWTDTLLDESLERLLGVSDADESPVVSFPEGSGRPIS